MLNGVVLASYDTGKKITGCKRQALVDTDERVLVHDPQAFDVQNHDRAGLVVHLSRRTFPLIINVFADAADRPASAATISINIVRKPNYQLGFVVHPRR